MKERPRPIPTGSLLCACAGLLMAAAPALFQTTPVAGVLFCFSAVLRVLIHLRRWKLPGIEVKLLILAVGGAMLMVEYGSVLGVEPGLGALLILVSLKLLETNSVRDFQVLILMGYFLSLCDLFFAQDLARWLYVAAVFLVLTTALIRFHHGAAAKPGRRPLRLAATLLAQAVPIILVLFLLFPRTSGGFRIQFGPSLLNSSGMSDHMEPGSIAQLALNDAVAFRADFPNGQIPDSSELYWRGLVLWHGDGLAWDGSGATLSVERHVGALQGEPIRQRIILQPHGANWLFALDRPSMERPPGNVPHAVLKPGGYLQSLRPVFMRSVYEVYSRPRNSERALPRDQYAAATAMPKHVSQAVLDLVAAWRNEAGKDEAKIVNTALNYFRDPSFSYSLSPGAYGVNALDEFLFQRRTGFCEHFAGAFASLMRVAGLPSRVVIGYYGGQYNAHGNYIIVRQADAHAWCEVWLKDQGWLRVDPTSVLTSEGATAMRGLNLTSRSNADLRADPAGSNASGWRHVFNEASLMWDNLTYQWDLHVLGYDEDSQQTLLAHLGLSSLSWNGLAISVAIVTGFLLAAIALWLRKPARRKADLAILWFDCFCRRLAQAGVHREVWEGPSAFADRAAAHLPAVEAQIRAISVQYCEIRYGRMPPPPDEFITAVQQFSKLPLKPSEAHTRNFP